MLWYRGDLMLQGLSALGQNGKMIQFNPYLIRFLISMEWHELTSFLEQFWRCVIFNFLWHKYYSLENAIVFFPFLKNLSSRTLYKLQLDGLMSTFEPVRLVSEARTVTMKLSTRTSFLFLLYKSASFQKVHHVFIPFPNVYLKAEKAKVFWIGGQDVEYFSKFIFTD